MNKRTLLLVLILLVASCTEEPVKNRLLEATIGGQLFTFTGIARKYNDYTAGQKTGIEYQVFNNEFNSLSIEAYDQTFTKTTFTFPELTATWKRELGGGRSVTYNAVSGQFRILGTEHGNLRGNFSFKVKNTIDPLDSLMITDGYFDIFLEESDRTF